MPLISEAQLAKIQSRFASERMRAQKVRQKAEEKASEMKSTLECVGAAAAVGWLRGKYEQPDGSWNTPFVAVDMELIIGAAAVGASFFDLFGKYDEDVLNAGNGILAHYTGQVMRKFGKTKTFSMVAGDMVGALPQYDPTSYNPTQHASPHADPVAAALGMSGV